jgi:hypothetical protein
MYGQVETRGRKPMHELDPYLTAAKSMLERKGTPYRVWAALYRDLRDVVSLDPESPSYANGGPTDDWFDRHLKSNLLATISDEVRFLLPRNKSAISQK